MAQRPIDKRPKLNTREALWHVMLEKKRFTALELSRETIYHKTTVRDYLEGLVAAGYLVREMINDCYVYSFAPDREIPAFPPRVRKDGSEITEGAGRKNLWRTAKIHGEFTVQELAVWASTDKVKIAENEAACYVKFLLAAGYLIVVTPAKNSGGRARYRFLLDRYTGPLAPKVQRIKQVFDPNLGKVVWSEGGADGR